jgi:DNA-binding Xre family transcriptional regulator
MIIILLKNLCVAEELKAINKETKIALSTLQNLYDNKASSINFNTLAKLIEYFKIDDIRNIIDNIVIEDTQYNFKSYNEAEYK